MDSGKLSLAVATVIMKHVSVSLGTWHVVIDMTNKFLIHSYQEGGSKEVCINVGQVTAKV